MYQMIAILAIFLMCLIGGIIEKRNGID